MKSGCHASEISLFQNLPESPTRTTMRKQGSLEFVDLLLKRVAAFGGAMLAVTDHVCGRVMMGREPAALQNNDLNLDSWGDNEEDQWQAYEKMLIRFVSSMSFKY
jgi:hypothetical protein